MLITQLQSARVTPVQRSKPEVGGPHISSPMPTAPNRHGNRPQLETMEQTQFHPFRAEPAPTRAAGRATGPGSVLLSILMGQGQGMTGRLPSVPFVM
jgi:hypothetical protein|mmetsp:Transcript_11856/g.21720  ORF Transcript_11856/g.21720 Transcript_11856/m.21720 type:complete len:97 (-) Transcript_11856:2144-2434(-)